MDTVLKGIRVLDLTRVLSGPFAAMILADMGAEVIKIERPGSGDDSRSFGPFLKEESVYFMSVNRNKKSITLDLKQPKGKEILKRLVVESDVLIENFRPGIMEKLGIGYASLKEVNPKLIYAAISGFGRSGPISKRAAYDGVVQAMGGLMSITGEKHGRPIRVGSSIGDTVAGIYCACGILAALRKRDQTNQGSLVDIAMLDSIVSILENAVARYQVTGVDPVPEGNTHQSIFPFETFPTASDEEIMIAAGNDALWAKLCTAIDCVELIKDPLLCTNPLRGENHDYMYSELCRGLRKKGAEEWYSILSEVGVPCSPINKVSHVLKNPQLKHRGMFQSIEHPVAGEVLVTGNPIKTGEDSEYSYRPAPVLGADTDTILQTLLGLKPEVIRELKQGGVV